MKKAMLVFSIAAVTLYAGSSAASPVRYIVLDANDNKTIMVATKLENEPGKVSLAGFRTGLASSCSAPFFTATSAKIDESKLLSCERASTSTQRAACSC